MKLLRRLLLGLAALLGVAWAGLAVYAYWPTGVEEVPARELAEPGDRFVMVDGLELRYRTWGEPGPGRPHLLLIHGFGNSVQSFRRVAPLLAGDYHVIAVDMPGFGLSAKPAEHDYTNPAQAAMMVGFIEALGLEGVVVGGHSLGGSIALRVAVESPRVSGLVLMNPGILNTGVPKIAEYWFFPFQRLSARQFGSRGFRESFLKRSFVDPDIVTDAVMDDLMRTVRSEGYMSGMTSMMGQYEAASEGPLMAEVDVPTLIVWGDEDRGKTLAELDELSGGIADSRVRRVAGAGHYVHEEAPDETAEAIIAAKPRWTS